MKRTWVTILAALVACSGSIGCKKDTSIPQPEWDGWVALPTPISSGPGSPQYDEGTINLTGVSGGADLGEVYIWMNPANNKLIEGFEVLDMNAYRVGQVKVSESYDTVQRELDTSFTVDEFVALMSNSVCTTGDAVCMAMREYAWVPFEKSSISVPSNWSKEVVAVDQFYGLDCPVTLSTSGKSGFVYRSRGTVAGGQVAWIEHWFVRTAAGSPYQEFKAPDRCQNPDAGDNEYQLELAVPVGAPAGALFLDQLKGKSCGLNPVAWCGFCTLSGSACEYAYIPLNWKRKNP